MSDPQESVEPLQRLPAGMPRRYAQYKPADQDAPAPPPTNVGGYDELLDFFAARGHPLPRTVDGLAAIDDLIGSADDNNSLAELARPIGMFYGDVLTHTISESYWEVIEDGYPRVRVTGRWHRPGQGSRRRRRGSPPETCRQHAALIVPADGIGRSGLLRRRTGR